MGNALNHPKKKQSILFDLFRFDDDDQGFMVLYIVFIDHVADINKMKRKK